MDKALIQIESIINNSIGKNRVSIINSGFDPIKVKIICYSLREL